MNALPNNAGAAFFGFMGVSLALVLASTIHLNQILEQPTELPRQELVSAVSPFGDQQSS
jgi:hypothetical protein